MSDAQPGLGHPWFVHTISPAQAREVEALGAEHVPIRVLSSPDELVSVFADLAGLLSLNTQ